jgi:ElaB/YqjD/DUF883 family membrane-anchored ribosome-binding protein
MDVGSKIRVGGKYPICDFNPSTNDEFMQTKIGNGHNVTLERLMDDIKAVVKDGEELLKTGMTGVKQRALAGAKTTDRAVREHPYQTIGAVFGLGVIVGVLVAGMFSRDKSEDDDY